MEEAFFTAFDRKLVLKAEQAEPAIGIQKAAGKKHKKKAMT